MSKITLSTCASLILCLASLLYSSFSYADPYCRRCGKVISITETEQKGKGGIVGKVGGGIAGGLVGNQIGGGNGKTIATIAGALGGAYAGNEIEKRTSHHTVYHVKVKLNDGSIHIVDYTHKPKLKVGQRIKFKNGELILR